MKVYRVTDRLPKNGQICLCFGNKTYCCSEDMDKIKKWHKVKFELVILSYSLKKEIPVDPEESILSECEVSEYWNILENEDDDWKEYVIGVTEWSPLR